MAKQSTEAYPGQRGAEKRALFKHFRVRVIEDVYRRRFFQYFDNRCFKCGCPEKDVQEIGAPPILCIDHHIPMFLGGHLVPGNLVALCRDCNNRKRDRPPSEFYTEYDLKRLAPLLEQQDDLFKFNFNWDKWQDDRENYLIEVGVSPDIARTVTTDEEHPHFVGLPNSNVGVTISISLEGIVTKNDTE